MYKAAIISQSQQTEKIVGNHAIDFVINGQLNYLQPQTNYAIYMVAVSPLFQSEVQKIKFKT